MVQFYSSKRRVVTQQAPQKLTITVCELDPFGQGVAHHQGKTIFVPGVLPNEQAEIELIEQKRQFAKGRLVHLLTQSPQREIARCSLFGICGGCQQQHAAKELQQQSKAAALTRILSREVGAIIPQENVISGLNYGYRRRARLALVWDAKKQQLVMGFRQATSKNLVPVSECPVLVPELSCLLQPLYHCLSRLRAVKHLGHVELVFADNGPVVILRHLKPLAAEDRRALLHFAQQQALIFYLAANSEQLEKLYGDTPYYSIDGLQVIFSPRDFIQVNDIVNQQMVAQAIEWLDISSNDRVLDLFCGMGNFSLALAKRAKIVIGVEGVASLVATATANAKRNGLDNALFFQKNLEEDDIEAQPWAVQGFDKIILDPARAGALGVMPYIVKQAPKRVVYVSCHATTLARDSKILLSAGYRLARVRMLDMFPHTAHLEAMVLFINDNIPGIAAK